jgi:predicted ABC-type ATPase
MDSIDALGVLAKGGAPAGYSPIPTGKKGGYRKKVGGAWSYWYPDREGARGGGASEPKGKKTGAAAEADFEHVPERNWVASVTEIGLPADTQKAHQENGEYTAERKTMHEKVYSKFLDHVQRVPDSKKPVAIVMMGGTAAGKGTVVRHVMGDHNDFVNVNPDDCKEEIPEYKHAINLGDDESGTPTSAKDAALMAHEESSDMAEEIRKRAIAGRKNLILDGTGKNAEKYARKLQELKDAGYHVRLFMPHVDMDEAKKRAKERAQRSGRYVPDDFVDMAHHLIPGNFQTIARAAHEAVLFDNSRPPPRPVWSIDNAKGASVVHDKKFVSEFQSVGTQRHAIAYKRGWLKKAMEAAGLIKAAGDTKEPSVPLDEMLERMKKNRGEAPDNATGIEDSEDAKKWREGTGDKAKKTEKSMDAIESLDALSKGFPPGKPTSANDDPSSKPAAAGAKKMAPQGGSAGKPGAGPAKPGAAPGNAGQGAKGADGEKPEPPAKPGEGQAGATAQPGLDPDKGSIQYPTKVQNPETGEFEFVYMDEAERDPNARFVVSDETGEGAHWECPQDSEHYDAFKQWKAARKKGLEGDQIPHELVQGAMKHAEKHHYDGGPHKAAYDDHLAHQGGEDAPTPPPSHHTVKNGNGSHPAMQGAQDKGKPGAEQGKPTEPGGTNGGQSAKGPPGNSGQGDKPAGPEQKKDLIGKLADFANPHEPSEADVSGGIPSGRSRSGTEHATSGGELQDAEQGYQSIYGNMRRSEDAIDALAPLSKARYTSRKRGADGKWKYTYEKPAGGGKKGGDKPKSPHVHSEGDKHYADSHLVNRAQRHMEDMTLEHMGFGEFYLEGSRGRIDFNRMAGKEFPGQSGRSHLLSDNKGGALVKELIEKEHASAVPEAKKSEAAMRFAGGGYDSLRKGLYAFDLSHVNKATPIADSLLYDYLCAFIEEAHEHEQREPQHGDPVAGEDYYQSFAMPVMHELVAMIPKNGNLARAAKKFKVTTEVVAEIMKKKGMIKPPTDGHHDHGDYWSHDWDSMTAMGTNERSGPTGEVLMVSDAREQLRIHAEPDAKRPLTLRKGPEMVHFGYDGRDVSGVVQRASLGQIHQPYGESFVKANLDPACLMHGRDPHSDQLGHQAFVKCSCPR